jgi:hypothetical protein
MIEIITSLPEHVAAFKATGKVTKDDYKKILMPEVDRIAKKFRKLSFLLLLETDVSNFTIGAWINDALVGIKHITQWQKIAIISNQNAVKKVTDIFGHLVPGEYKGFKIAELEAAKKWVSANS